MLVEASSFYVSNTIDYVELGIDGAASYHLSAKGYKNKVFVIESFILHTTIILYKFFKVFRHVKSQEFALYIRQGNVIFRHYRGNIVILGEMTVKFKKRVTGVQHWE